MGDVHMIVTCQTCMLHSWRHNKSGTPKLKVDDICIVHNTNITLTAGGRGRGREGVEAACWLCNSITRQVEATTFRTGSVTLCRLRTATAGGMLTAKSQLWLIQLKTKMRQLRCKFLNLKIITFTYIFLQLL